MTFSEHTIWHSTHDKNYIVKRTFNGEENGMFGKHHKKNSLHKIGNATRGKHCYNNGIKNVFAFECPKGFVKGMLRNGK